MKLTWEAMRAALRRGPVETGALVAKFAPADPDDVRALLRLMRNAGEIESREAEATGKRGRKPMMNSLVRA